MKVFVTGADGMLGSNTVRELLERDYQVKVFLQKGKKSDTLKDLKIEKSYGDILDIESISSEMEGADVVIHIAANTSIWPSRSEIVRKVNIEGSRNCAEACIKNNVKKLIYIGTANSFGFGDKQNPGNEESPFIAGKFHMDYIDSKYEAHQLILEYVKTKKLPAVIINPTFMIGPYDSKPGSGAMLIAIYNQKSPGYIDGGRNFVYVKDVAVAICNAITKGEVGQDYIAGGHNYTYKEAFTLMAETMGVKVPICSIPGWMAVLFGHFCETKAKITKKQPTVTCNAARIAQVYQYYSSEKAAKLLDMPQTPLNIAIKEAQQWFLKHGYIKEKKQ